MDNPDSLIPKYLYDHFSPQWIKKRAPSGARFILAEGRGYRQMNCLFHSFAKENDFVAFFGFIRYTEPYQIFAKI